MGSKFWKDLLVAILTLFFKKSREKLVRKLAFIFLTLFFALLGLVFLALAIVDILEIYFPPVAAKSLLALTFFILAVIFKSRW